jgi:hypothetical protein
MKIGDLKTKKPRKPGKVKMWNGTAVTRGKQWHIYIGATSVRQALELVKEAGFGYMGASHLKNYFSPMWGNDMAGIEPEIGVWGKPDANRYIHDPVQRLV